MLVKALKLCKGKGGRKDERQNLLKIPPGAMTKLLIIFRQMTGYVYIIKL